MQKSIIGLTGGIASGKSTFARRCQSLGVAHIDADQVARELLESDSPLLKDIREALGEDIFDLNQIDRARLASIIFNDDQARKTLEEIMHPEIRKRILAMISAEKSPVVLVELPVLRDRSDYPSLDSVWYFKIETEQQKARLMARDNLDEASAEARMAAQVQEALAQSTADIIIDSDEDVELAYQKVVKLSALS